MSAPAPFAPIPAGRLFLQPITASVAAAILEGDLTGIPAGEGWPHDDTLDGLRLAVGAGFAPGWFVTLDGQVIGDCGTHGPADAEGEIEIGYGLAPLFRGRGHGTELVRALSGWLLAQPGILRVRARINAQNVPSRRALERAGFTLAGREADVLRYALAKLGPEAHT